MTNNLNDSNSKNFSLAQALSSMVLRATVFFSLAFASLYIIYGAYGEFSDFQSKAYREFKLSHSQFESHLNELQEISDQIAKFVSKVARYNATVGDINSDSKELIKLYLNQLLDSSAYPLVAAIIYSSEIPPLFIFQTGIYSDFKFHDLIYNEFLKLTKNENFITSPVGIKTLNFSENLLITSKSKDIIYGSNDTSRQKNILYPKTFFVTLVVKGQFISDYINKQISTSSQRGLKIGIDISNNDNTLYNSDLFQSPIDYAISKKYSEKIPLNKESIISPENYVNFSINISSFDNFLVFIFRTLGVIACGCVFVSGIFFVVKRKLPSYINPLLEVVSDIEQLESSSYQKQMPVFGAKEIFLIRDIIEKMRIKIIKIAALESKAELASQVSHDIRSPLAALNMITRSLQDIPEDKRLMIRNSIQRINDIANDLLNKGKQSVNPVKDNSDKQMIDLSVIEAKKTTEVILLPALIDSLVSEKRIQYRDQIQVQIQSDLKNSFGDFVLADGKELMRVLSNLINNSVEAFDNKGGEVTVSIEKNAQPASGQSEAEACKSMLLITVKDNGKGIPANVLEKLGDVGVSFGKEGSQSGSGIGIYHAKKTIEEFGGKFKIISQVGVGTEVQIYLPKTKSPVWFLESLKILNNSLVISLDDDISIHQIWKGRLSSLNASAHQVQLQSFTSAEEFKKFVLFKTNFNSDAKYAANQFYLIDYELLGQNTNGLKIIEELGLQNNVTLVTSRYEEPQIQQKCEQLGIKLLPKQLAGFVPMELEEIISTATQPKYDWILIDDDPLVHMTWQFMSKERQKTFLGFKSYKEFCESKHNIDPTSNFYIDSNLGDGIKGEVIAKQMHSEGYKNLFIATGYAPDQFKNLDCITDVIGKEPPMF